MKIGVYVYGIAAVAYGITDLVWGEFDPSDQPLQAWGNHIPGAKIFAYIAAIWLVVAGAALLWRRSRRSAAASLTILYGIFVLFPLPRFYWGPNVHGHRAYVYFGVLGDVCQEIILFVAAVIVWKSQSGRDSLSQRAARLVRWTVRALLNRFRPRAPDRRLDGGSNDPQMDALRCNLLGGAHRDRIRLGGRGHHIGGARRSGSQPTWTDAASFQCIGIRASDLFFSARTLDLGRQRL
jgi:uncharacterized membrane protein YphA (DoxX/SURF4 family)